MNSKDCKEIKDELKNIHEKINAVHDDVLVLKTQRDMTTKFILVVAGFVSFIISLVVRLFGG